MTNDLAVPILSYEDINRRADEFLKEHGRSGTLPVNIEEIAEFDLCLDIFPFPRLQETYDVEGFISGDLTMVATCVRTMFQNFGVWLLSIRWASSWTMT
jgi:hypothetical protein